MNIIFDGNYLYHRNFSVFCSYYKGQEMSEVLADKEKMQVLMRKCVIDMCHTVRNFTNVETVTFVIDSSSWRYRFYDNYKYSLTRVRPEYYEKFLEGLYMFENLLRKHGIIVSRVDGAEGDDLLYMWSIYYGSCLNEESVIVTGDSDIRQLVTNNISVFCNNSKKLSLHCLPENCEKWEKYLDSGISVFGINPFEILLYKVIMGDNSDNIPKLKSGFGNVAFSKFINSLGEFSVPECTTTSEMSNYIKDIFSKYIKEDIPDLFEKILFNVKMTWLNLAVYNDDDFLYKNKNNLITNMLHDIKEQKDKYNYIKTYTLEDFYGFVIK